MDKIKKYLGTLLLWIGALVILSCNGNLHIDPLLAESEEETIQNSAFEIDDQAIIRLEDLGSTSSNEQWSDYFSQLGSGNIWVELLESTGEVKINFNIGVFFEETHADLVTEGIIHYLVSQQRYLVKTLEIIADTYEERKRITVIPGEIGQLTGLQTLLLENHAICELPNEMEKLTNLTKLSLYGNLFKDFPPVVAKLVSLKHLDLMNNQLKELPPGMINKLPNLKLLYLLGNSLNKLPVSSFSVLRRLEDLCGLWISDNPWIPYISKGFIKFDIQELRKKAFYKVTHLSFPSLCMLCIKCIEDNYSNLEQENAQVIEASVPEPFVRDARIRLLEQAGYWEEGNNIICWLYLVDNYYPFYLDYRLITPQDIKIMLQELDNLVMFEEGTLSDKSFFIRGLLKITFFQFTNLKITS